MTLRVIAMASGRGSNFRALVDAQNTFTITHLLCDRDAPAREIAASKGIPSTVVSFDKKDRPGWDRRLRDAALAAEPDVVILAGFMRILGPAFVEAFAGRIINVHPSLLPAFPGTHAPAQALAAGVRLSGCTVHVVDEGVDTGPILAQSAVPVLPSDTEETLHLRIQECEHRLLPSVVDALATGALVLDPPRWVSADWPASIDSPSPGAVT